jgi:hypothetical protein
MIRLRLARSETSRPSRGKRRRRGTITPRVAVEDRVIKALVQAYCLINSTSRGIGRPLAADVTDVYQRASRLFAALALARGDGRYAKLLRQLARVGMPSHCPWPSAALSGLSAISRKPLAMPCRPRLQRDNQDGGRIASPEMLPEADPLPHVTCEQSGLGSGDGADQYGNTR